MYGYSKSKEYRQRISILETMLLFMEFTENQIRFLNSSIDDIINSALKDDRFTKLSFIHDKSSFKFVDRIDLNINVSKKEAEHIKNYLCELGSTDAAGQLSISEMHKGIISKDMQECEKDLLSKGKLYKHLSVLAAIAFAVILI